MALPSLEELNKIKKERRTQNSSASEGGSANILPSLEELRELKRSKTAMNMVGDLAAKVDKWLTDSGSYIDSYNTRFVGRDNGKYVADSGSWLDTATKTKTALDAEKAGILETLNKYGKYYDQDWVASVREALSGNEEVQNQIIAAATQDVDFWGQFDPTEQQKAAGYDTAEKVYNAWRVDNKYQTKHEGKSRDEIEHAILYAEDDAEADWLRKRATELWTSEDEQARYDRAELQLDMYRADLRRYNDAIKNLGAGSQVTEAIIDEINKKYGGRTNLQNMISQQEAQLTTAGRNLEAMRMSEVNNPNSGAYDPAFEGFAAYDPAIASGDYAYLNMDKEDRTKYVNGQMVHTTVPGDTSAIDANNAMRARYEMLDQLTQDEIAVYNYWYKKHGAEKAAEYLQLLTDTMNKRVGSNIFSGIEGNTLAELAYATVAGLDQFGSGMRSLVKSVAGDDSYTPTSAIQYAGGMVREDLGNVDLKWYNFKDGSWEDAKIFGNSLGQSLYDLGTTTANMAPSILTSTAIGLINPAAGTVTGAALLGGSAAGNAYQEKINLGYSGDEARVYGYMVGASEAVLEYLLGGVSKLGGKAMGAISTKMLDKVDNVLARVAKSTGGKLLMAASSEAFEEGLQSIIEPYLWQAVSGEEAQVDWEETLYSALMGFMSGGIFEGFEQIGSERRVAGDTNAWKDVTNAVSNPLRSYPAAKRNTIQSFIGAVDQKIKSFAQSVKSGDKSFRREKISDVSDRAAADIGELLGIDVSGYTNNINTNGMRHIINRHGENGAHDSTMAIADDIARVGWVLDNYDSVEILTEGGEQMYSSEFRDSNDNPAPQIRFIKKIDGTYYVVEAACENKYKKLWVQSTYLQKNEDVTQAPAEGNQTNHETNAQSALASPSSLTSISDTVAGVNGENIDPVTQLARETVEAQYAQEDGAGLDGISAEGRAIYGDQAVDVVDIDQVGGGKVTVKLADGRSVDAAALEYDDSGEAELWRVIGKYAEDAESARALLEEYRKGDLDAYKYARGVEEGFLYGKLNMSAKEMELQGSYVNLLNPMQRNMAYKQGVIAGQKKAQQRKAESSERNTKRSRKGFVNYGYEGQKLDESKLTPAQKVGVDFAKRLARKKGMTFYFYRSFMQNGVRVFKNAQGEIVQAEKNGWYNPSDGSIHIDLNSGDMGSTVLYTIAHELTHFIQDWSADRYRTLCGIITEGFLGRGQSVDRLVKTKMEEYRKHNIKLTYEQAYDEVMASSMEGVLSDGRVMDLLDAAETKDMTLAEQLKSFFMDVADLIHDTLRAYRDVEPESPEGRMVMRMEDLRHQLQDVFAAGLHEGGENFRDGGKINTAPEGGVKYSYIGDTKDGRRCYQSDFDSSISMDERIELFKKRIATIFNLGAVELKTDVKKIKILGDKFTSQKNLFGDSKPKGSEYTAKINSLYDLADILATSKYDPNATGKEPSYANPGDKPKNAAHKNVKYWYKFKNEIVFDGVPYTVTFNIRDKGTAQYQYLIEFKENKTPGISNTAVKKPPANAPSVLQGQYTQSGSKSQQNSLRYQKNEAAQSHIAEQNASMAEDMDGLNQLVAAQRQGKAARIRESTVDAAASFLMKTAGAKGEKNQLIKSLADFYSYVANSTEQTWESIREEAMPVVRWLMANTVRTKQRSEYAQDILNTLRGSRISLDEVQRGEVAHLYGSFGAFRNTVMGSVILANDGISLDSQWQEWAEMYPDVFRKNMNAADMPEALSDIISRLRNDNTSELEYEYNREFIEQELLSRVYDSYWNASTLYSVADHYEGQIKQLKKKHRQRMQMVYARHQAAEAQQRNTYHQRQEAAKAHYEEQYQRREAAYKESRQRAVERHNQAQVRQKIKRVVRDLWKLQERAPKDRRTKEELREFVDNAIKAVDLVYLERYDEYDMVRNGVGVDVYGENARIMQECKELLEKHLEISDADVDTRWDIDAALQQAKDKAALDKELSKRMKILRDAGVFAAEFKRLHEFDAGQLIDDLVQSYEKLKETDSPYLKGAYQESLPKMLQGIKKDIGTKPVRNMTLQELEQLYEAYSAVLHVVRNANKTFFDDRAADVNALGTGVVGELEDFKRHKMSRMVIENLKRLGWNNLTPAYAFRLIGSKTLERLYNNMVAGMGIYGRDIAEAKVHWQKQARKYGANNWDMDKRTEFVDKTGIKFSLSLGQLMSLYALSKRQQALGHLEIGGIMLDTTEKYIENIVDRVLPKQLTHADTFKLDKTALEGICSKLTAEQRAFVDATQQYLSADMAEKGNQVSMKLYGIRLFKEKFYFPLRTASQTRYESTELIDQNKLKNSGFTKETNPKASNAVVLSDYSRVWTGHVKQMSLYHGMTLAMEDMDRILNFGKTFERDADGNIKRDKDGNPIEQFTGDSVSTALQNIYGEHPESYIRELMKQLNGGVRSDNAEKTSSRMLSRFKKAAVAGSLSVWIQQWTSVFRAMAHVPMKYFFQKPLVGTYRKKVVAEMKEHCPIAIIKEMGGFDTGIGSSEHDYITMLEPENLKEIASEVKKHPLKRFDELTGWLPGRADESTWAHIWTAVKRETRDKQPGLRTGSAEFYKAASDRFTEVINLTQVYDSVLSKSALMRSKGFGMKMVTQFAAEPTLTLNMAVNAVIQHERTGKVQLGTAVALVGSVVANAMCSALIYAMRDDDEEETFLEKYSASVLGNLLDGLNPLTYMPIVRDVWSAFQGYDVKRSDMELWSQLASALEQVVRKYNDDDATDKEKAEAWAGAADWLLTLLGVPEKNIRRELKGFGNLWRTLEKDFTVRDTTKLSLQDANQDAFWSSIPLMRLIKGETKGEKLVDALVAGDTHYADRLRGTYKTADAANNAVVRVIKERFEGEQLTEEQAVEQLEKFAGKAEKNAQEYLIKWNFAIDNPNSGLEAAQVPKYVAYAEPAGISTEIYAEYCGKKSGYSKREDILRVIHALPISKKQKDALYFAEGYAESTLDEAPWH